MNRLSALLLLSALLAAATAAPAPPPKPPKAWVTGWKAEGEGRFEPDGEKLAFTHPNGPKGLGTEGRMLRDVEGDFDVQVRVAGDFRSPRGVRRAGVYVTDGQAFVRVAWMAEAGKQGKTFYADCPGVLAGFTSGWLEAQ